MLKLEAELPKRAKLSFWPFLDLCVIGMFFVLFSSKFVMTPGITLALPEVESSQVATSSVYEVIAVTEVKGAEMIFFDGSKYDLDSLTKLFSERGKAPEGATLLVKADVAVSMGTLSLLSSLAIESGYSRVQLATEERRSASGAFGGGR